jgi:hypothetical protein
MEEGIYRIFYCDVEVGEPDSFDLRFRPVEDDLGHGT